jgi:hypothetical protein
MIPTQMRHAKDCQGSVARDPASKGMTVFVCKTCGARSTTDPRR